MARVQGMVDADWSVDRATGNIRYIGDDHTLSGGSPSYATIIQFHRWLQDFADNEAYDAGGADTDNVEVDIIDLNPSNRSTDNIASLVGLFNVTAAEIEHLYDGTLIQGTGPTEERWDGIVNFGNASAHLQVLQDGAILADDYWNYGWEAGSETGAGSATVMTDSTLGATTNQFVGYTILNVTDGSRGIITANTATTVTVAELYGGTLNTWTTADIHHIAVPLNPDAAQGISSRFMIKTREDGVDIDRRRLVGTSRRYGNTYSEFKINGTSQGNNVFALSDSGDLNNTTSWATIDAIADITNTEGLRDIDISGDGTTEEYYSEWTRGAQTINTFFEYLKMSSSDATAETLQGESGELHRGPTHSFPYDLETGAPTTATNDKHVYGTFIDHGAVGGGPFVVGEAIHEDTATPVWKGRVLGVDTTGLSLIVDVEFGTVGTEGFTGQTSGATATAVAPTGGDLQLSAGECKVLAFDDQGTSGVFYVQVTKGIAPLDNTLIYDATDHTAFYTVSADSTERAISTPFVGVSTGSALIGGYGLGLVAGDTAAADTYFDLSNTPITPPNNVTMVASGYVSGDYVLCTNDDGASGIDFTQMATTGGLINGAAVTEIPVVAIPSDTPATTTKGGIRVERDDGLYSLHRYTSLDLGTDIFTIPSFDFSTNNVTNGNNVFVSYLDLTTSSTSDSFSYVFNATRTHFLRVRNGATPIKTAEATGDMTSTGGVISVSTIPDA
jgi:hypothetical protein